MGKKKGPLERSFMRLVPTDDEWCPCIFEHGKPHVKATLMIRSPGHLHNNREQWLVSISFWGDDDLGIEKEQYFDSDKEAFACYHELEDWLEALENADMKELLEQGFENA